MEEIVKNLKACILISKGGISESRIGKDYYEVTGDEIPFRSFNFATLEEFLREIPDIRRTLRGNEYFLETIPSDKTAHVAELVRGQKREQKKPRRVSPFHIPARTSHESHQNHQRYQTSFRSHTNTRTTLPHVYSKTSSQNNRFEPQVYKRASFQVESRVTSQSSNWNDSRDAAEKTGTKREGPGENIRGGRKGNKGGQNWAPLSEGIQEPPLPVEQVYKLQHVKAPASVPEFEVPEDEVLSTLSQAKAPAAVPRLEAPAMQQLLQAPAVPQVPGPDVMQTQTQQMLQLLRTQETVLGNNLSNMDAEPNLREQSLTAQWQFRPPFPYPVYACAYVMPYAGVTYYPNPFGIPVYAPQLHVLTYPPGTLFQQLGPHHQVYGIPKTWPPISADNQAEEAENFTANVYKKTLKSREKALRERGRGRGREWGRGGWFP